MKNHLLKIFSIVVSFALWSYISNTKRIEIEKSFELEFSLPDGVALSANVPEEVSITLSGPRLFMRKILLTDQKYPIDLSQHKIKNYYIKKVKLSPAHLSLPMGVEVTKISPQTLNIRIEKAAVKTLPVEVQLLGDQSLKQTYDYKLNPEQVRISGPRKLLETIESIKTQEVALEVSKEPRNLELELVSPYKQLKLSESNVKLRYQMIPTTSNLTLVRPIRILSSRRNLRSRVKRAKLHLYSFNKDVDEAAISIVADVPEGQSGRFEVPLKAHLPKGVYLLKIEPQKIQIESK